MDLKGKKYLYANGSSLLSGGGFEPIELRTEIREKYKEKGIELPDSQLECSFPYLLSKKLGLECINDSKSGSGVDRMIRTTFEWIEKNEDKIGDTLFLLEPPVGIRLDFYIKEWNEYGIINAHKNNEGEYPFTLVKDWFTDNELERIGWNTKYYESITKYFNNFYDEELFRKKEDYTLLFFVSYLNQKNIDYVITLPNIHDNFTEKEIMQVIPNERNIDLFLDNCGLWRYCEIKGWLIKDEVDFDDNHIGFYGNQKISEKVFEFFKQ
jgi:hypothetical protein